MPEAEDRSEFSDIISYSRENLKYELSEVEALLTEFPEETSEIIHKVTRHIISTGGKRIRAILTLLSARALEYSGDKHINLAAAIEGIHTATLLHDDVVDESNYRRSKTAAHMIWGNKTSILVGDYLFSKAFRLMTSCNSLECLKRLSGAASIISEGEIKQLTHLGDPEITTETYFDIIGSKTAELFGVACEVGGIISGASRVICNNLYSYGYNLGLIFQIKDDELDYTGDKSTGKKPGTDFIEGKLTLPVIIAYSKANSRDAEFWRRTIVNLDQKQGDFNTARSYIASTEVKEEVSEIINIHHQRALSSLKQIPQGENNRTLKEMINFALQREF
jgi:octaprenyl-diphosphate synthase